MFTKRKRRKKKNKNQELFGQRKIKPVGWSLVGFTNFRRKSFAQLSENSTLIINYSVIISLQRSTQNCVTNVTLPLNKHSNKRVSQIILMQCIQHSWQLTIKLEPFTLVEPPENCLFTPQTSWCSSSKIKQFQITSFILFGKKI